MPGTGLWTAYEVAKMASAANETKRLQRRSKQSSGLGRRRGQLRAHIAKRDEQLKMLKSIEFQLANPLRGRFDRRCPECSKAFIVIKAKEIEIEACLDCGSFWFDDGELQRITNRTKDVPGKSVLAGSSDYKCPVCGDGMEEHTFMRQHELQVDLCPKGHGVYLEAGELERAIDLSLALKLKPDQ